MYNYDSIYPYSRVNNNKNIDLFGTYEGFVKGNLFRNLYKPYNNYKPNNIVINNEKDELLLNLNQLEFATHELNLYLDVFPNDINVINEFNKLSNQYKRVLNEYEQKYGPLFVRDNNSNNWNWLGGEK